ncbi:GNAT family N-acetyltransferase [Brevibacillus laterosporus]|uniref:GNAT family N-acetyltransferase n=1 Tax=Brevibacillus laterosporus TaxID=1465 RepID=UPI0018CFA8C0|nr:GNAT family N-acetyltransferase [Brevibacillus laterosporus]MBG9790354.1 GCN5 family acetyltransferase [Brevibacillus laterosporus]
MFKAVRVTSTEMKEEFCSLAGPSANRIDTLDESNADAHWMILDNEGVAARCSLWWSHVPPYQDHQVGLIGHYAALNSAAAVELLQLSSRELEKKGCTIAIGPMDGSTWKMHRLVTKTKGDLPFFLEPTTPVEWADHFTQDGFDPLAHYISRIVDLDHRDLGEEELEFEKKRYKQLTQHMSGLGISVRQLDLTRMDEELKRIYELSTRAFRQNFLYTEISEDEFLKQYKRIVPYIQPELVLLAEHGDRLVGFMFTLPDVMQSQLDRTIDQVILKTLAVDPKYQGYKIGSFLVKAVYDLAQKLGYKRAINALMIEKNRSTRFNSNEGYILRDYTLFAKKLEREA